MRLFIPLMITFLAGCASAEPKDQTRIDESSNDPEAQQGEPCNEMDCADGLDCIEYSGIAGPSGPTLTSCEIPCADNDSCPTGQACITIADGPGQVCRVSH